MVMNLVISKKTASTEARIRRLKALLNRSCRVLSLRPEKFNNPNSNRPDLFSEIKYMVDKHNIGNMEHISSKTGPSIKNQFDEFKNMFKDLRKDKQKLQEDEPIPFFGDGKLDPPASQELDQYQKIIDDLVIKRYNDEDNAFLKITEMDYFEQFRVYQDGYPLYNLRMKLWNTYMYALVHL